MVRDRLTVPEGSPHVDVRTGRFRIREEDPLRRVRSVPRVCMGVTLREQGMDPRAGSGAALDGSRHFAGQRTLF